MMKLKMASPTQHHLVLLPGLDGTGELFNPLLSVLPATFQASVVRFPPDRLISHWELLGCIRSVIPWDHPYVLVAESAAGPLALKFVEAQRQDIRAVVLCASFVSKPTPPARSWIPPLLAKPWLAQAPTRQTVRKYLLGEDAPEPLVERATDALRSLKPEVWAARAQMVFLADARQALLACEKPILYLQATDDQFVGRAALEEIKRLKPSVKTAVVKGPHALLQRNPREAIAVIGAFLGELSAARS